MLRKGGFRAQLFDDVRMERERDVREEVGKIMNKSESDFEGLKAWNDYLEEKEGICFGLSEGVDVGEMRGRLEKYRVANEADIEMHAVAERDAEAEWEVRERQEREMVRLRREAARREEEEEKREAVEGRRRIVDDMAKRGGDADDIARKGAERLNKSKGMKTSAEKEKEKDTFVIRGLKKPSKPQPELPYDPFGDVSFDYRYFNMPDTQGIDFLDQARENPLVSAGGYDVDDYCRNLLSSAFSGLGVFVGSEMTGIEAT